MKLIQLCNDIPQCIIRTAEKCEREAAKQARIQARHDKKISQRIRRRIIEEARMAVINGSHYLQAIEDVRSYGRRGLMREAQTSGRTRKKCAGHVGNSYGTSYTGEVRTGEYSTIVCKRRRF